MNVEYHKLDCGELVADCGQVALLLNLDTPMTVRLKG